MNFFNFFQEDLYEYFKKFGLVQKAYIIFDPKNGKYKDFGFVEFKNKDSADMAFQLANHLIGTCMVTVHRYGKRKRVEEKIQEKNQAKDSYLLKLQPIDFPPLKNNNIGKNYVNNLESGDHIKSSRCLFDLYLNNEQKENSEMKKANLMNPQQKQEEIEEGNEVENNSQQDALDDNEGEETPNQESSSDKYVDLLKTLEIYSMKDRISRLDGILELSLLKENEEKYYKNLGVNVSMSYRVNPRDYNFGSGTY